MFRFFRFRLRPKRLLITLTFVVYVFVFYFILVHTSKKPLPISKDISSSPTTDAYKEQIAVLLIVCDRTSVTRTLDQLLKYRPSVETFPLVVSRDCGKKGKLVDEILQENYAKNITYIKHPNYEAVKAKLEQEKVAPHMRGYFHIAQHFGWALNYTFNNLSYDNVIIVEDDLDISPDFFEYFEATLLLLHKDRTIWCISAYNHNGNPELIDTNAPGLLHRTDFFTGLGWMMTKTLWQELQHKWPTRFWDDWMTDPNQRKGRVCIHPEISRSKTFGKIGVSNGQFFEEHLQTIQLYKSFFPFKSQDLTYLLKQKYDSSFIDLVESATNAESLTALKTKIESSVSMNDSFRLFYDGQTEFEDFSKTLGVMEDFRGGVPRNSYKGIVSFMFNGRRVYLQPK